MVAVAQSPIRGLGPENPQKFFVTVSAGGRVPQRCQEGQAAKNGWYLRERLAPEHGRGRPHRLRVCEILRHANPISGVAGPSGRFLRLETQDIQLYTKDRTGCKQDRVPANGVLSDTFVLLLEKL